MAWSDRTASAITTPTEQGADQSPQNKTGQFTCPSTRLVDLLDKMANF